MEIHKTPLEYLKQRVRYYESKVKEADRMLENPNIVKRMGVDAIMNNALYYHKMLRQFREAAITIAGKNLVDAISTSNSKFIYPSK